MGAEVEADTDAESHCGWLDELLRKPVGELLKVQSLAAVKQRHRAQSPQMCRTVQAGQKDR